VDDIGLMRGPDVTRLMREMCIYLSYNFNFIHTLNTSLLLLCSDGDFLCRSQTLNASLLMLYFNSNNPPT
jgi:hypothetical protein